MSYLRSLIALLILFVAINATAQQMPVDDETKLYAYSGVVEVDSLSKEEIYKRYKQWAKKYYKSEKYENDDAEKATLLKIADTEIQLTYDYKYKAAYKVTFDLKLDIKDSKYRFTFTNFKIYKIKTGPSTETTLEVAYGKMITQNKNETTTQMNKYIDDTIADIEKFITTGELQTDDDW